MSLNSLLIPRGKLQIVRHTFELAGDELPEHDHLPGECHITIVGTGSIKVITPTKEEVLYTNALITFKPYEKHKVIALENNTVVFNIAY